MLSGNMPDKKQNVVANMFAHLALAVERRRGAVNRIGLQQHLADIAQRAALSVAHFVELLGLAELAQHICDVVLHLGIAQTNLAVEVIVNQFSEQTL